MKTFLFKTLFFLITATIIFLSILSSANGYTDTLYRKFTTPKATSLILGTSRAAQGLQPTVLDSILNTRFLNYSFTILHSPYGSTYLNSIKNKINPETVDGTFILTVDPWSLSSFTVQPDDSLSFREVNLALGNTKIVNLKPNPVYVFKNLDKRYYELFFYDKTKFFVHKDGWLEVNLDLDSIKIETIQKKLAKYRSEMLPVAQFSNNRYQNLLKTISFLKDYGEVYLVRLPVHPQMMMIDSDLMPYFNDVIVDAITLSDGYLDLSNRNSEFMYTDGNHLHKSSGRLVSSIVANWISSHRIQSQ